MLLVCSSHPAFFPISVTQEVYVALPPMYHCYGLVLIMLLGLYRGAKIVTMTGFTVQSYLQATQSHKVWNIFAVVKQVIFIKFLDLYKIGCRY